MSDHIHPGGARAVIHGNVILDKPGAVLDQDVHGLVLVRAANVTIKNNRIFPGESCPECDAA